MLEMSCLGRGIMADDIVNHRSDPLLDGALERFERAEAELEETDERRRRLADEAARAAAELESTLDEAIRKSIGERDRLEEELAVVADHISRLESIRARSAGRNEGSPSPPPRSSAKWVRKALSRSEKEPRRMNRPIT